MLPDHELEAHKSKALDYPDGTVATLANSISDNFEQILAERETFAPSTRSSAVDGRRLARRAPARRGRAVLSRAREHERASNAARRS